MHVWPVDLNESIVKKGECNSQDCAGFTDVVCNCGFDFAKKSLSHIFKNVPESSIAAL
jgi:predicted peptidase